MAMNQKMTLKQRMLNFMQGRYGVDQLSGFLIWMAVIIAVITMFVRIPVLQIVTWVMSIYAYVRIFSKQINKRYAQNQKFLCLQILLNPLPLHKRSVSF